MELLQTLFSKLTTQSPAPAKPIDAVDLLSESPIRHSQNTTVPGSGLDRLRRNVRYAFESEDETSEHSELEEDSHEADHHHKDLEVDNKERLSQHVNLGAGNDNAFLTQDEDGLDFDVLQKVSEEIKKHPYYFEGITARTLLNFRDTVRNSKKTFNVYRPVNSRIPHLSHLCFIRPGKHYQVDLCFTFFCFEFRFQRNPHYYFDPQGKFKFDFLAFTTFIKITQEGFDTYSLEKEKNGEKALQYLDTYKGKRGAGIVLLNQLIEGEMRRHLKERNKLLPYHSRITCRELAENNTTLIECTGAQKMYKKIEQFLLKQNKSLKLDMDVELASPVVTFQSKTSHPLDSGRAAVSFSMRTNSMRSKQKA